MGNLCRSVVVVGAVLVGLGVLPAAASADIGATGREFGGHVVMCEQTMGFDGQHNPGGMHHGFAAWDPAHICCPIQSIGGSYDPFSAIERI
jgi:hypothetical protein